MGENFAKATGPIGPVVSCTGNFSIPLDFPPNLGHTRGMETITLSNKNAQFLKMFVHYATATDHSLQVGWKNGGLVLKCGDGAWSAPLYDKDVTDVS